MIKITQDLNLIQTTVLLKHYGFEIKGYSLQELIERWAHHYPVTWIRLAVVEALYQGRYKVISVEQILKFWLRRGTPVFHFTHEFERLICNDLPDFSAIKFNFSEPSPVEKPSLHSSHAIPEPEPPKSVIKNDPKATLTDLNKLFSELFYQRKKLITENSTLSPATETTNSNGSSAIHEFIPLLDRSELYSKLKAVVRRDR